MDIIICFLLISGLPALIDGSWFTDHVEEEIKWFLRNGGSNIIDSNSEKLVFSENKRLGATSSTVVKKGTYNNIDVAIKITASNETFRQEFEAYNALNAIGNEEIEKHGIPCIYYHGTIIGQFNAFAMTLFDGTLADRVKEQQKTCGQPLSELAVTLIMKQAVQTLAYLADKRVVHNDIKPENIFILGEKVFIADFGLGTLNDEQCSKSTLMFASSSFHAGRKRYAVDDLESLIYTMWYAAGVPLGSSLNDNSDKENPDFSFNQRKDIFSVYYSFGSEGRILWECEEKGEARQRMEKKCAHFKELKVRHAFELICIQEIVSRKKVPAYEEIISLLTTAISEVNSSSVLPEVEANNAKQTMPMQTIQ